jgi:response regulator RpfG family c-di-GMP phosphodiesterase
MSTITLTIEDADKIRMFITHTLEEENERYERLKKTSEQLKHEQEPALKLLNTLCEGLNADNLIEETHSKNTSKLCKFIELLTVGSEVTPVN